jgi:uncharacterized protein YndB with AHSA1/START domain
MSTDRIEKKIVLRAPKGRVWRAIADAKEFGTWFRVKLEGPFVEGQRLKGNILYPGYEHLVMDVVVEKMEPERLLSFRWHPNAIDPKVDYDAEPTTLVEFRLEEVAGGTELTLVESGFDRIPAARRAEAYRGNDGGWIQQLENVRKHVEV